jgi:sialate O-acetylesterase
MFPRKAPGLPFADFLAGKRLSGKRWGILLFLLFKAQFFTGHAAELTFAGIFTDHTVLQRDVAVPVWGWADPDEQITVAFAAQNKSATADATGKWLVRLDAMPASTQGGDLVVQSTINNRQSRISDVVVGDVWLCSGQSNMHFRMQTVENAPQEIAAAHLPTLRFFTVEHQFGQKSSDRAGGAWTPVSPATAGDCSAVAFYFGMALQQKTGVPIGLLVSSVGGTRIESWMRPETLASTGVAGPLIEKWGKVSPVEFENIATAYRDYQHQRDQLYPQAVKAAKANSEPIPPEPKAPKQRCHDCPSALHHGMIAPLQPFALRGAIWYQGESNSGQPAAYEKLLPALIGDWRRVWGEKLPFLFVQLAPHQTIHPAFREAQQRIWQMTPQTAMVGTLDVGDARNIHPVRKRPVGERLALAARALSFGEKIEYSGPVFESMSIEGNRAGISFTHAGEGLMAKGGALNGFTIAGPNGKFIPASARIEGSTVVVTSDQIANPVAVRYGWATVPDANLFSREGLPALPFRSDLPANLKPGQDSK